MIDAICEAFLGATVSHLGYVEIEQWLERFGRQLKNFKVGQKIKTTNGFAWVDKVGPDFIEYTYLSGNKGKNEPYFCIPLNEFKTREPKPGDRVLNKLFSDWNADGYLIFKHEDSNELGVIWVARGVVQSGIDTKYIVEALNSGEWRYV